MKAAYYDVPGGPEVLSYTDVEAPVCPEDGVLLRVEAISIEGGDLINRATAAPQAAGHVPGYAASGEIIEVVEEYLGQIATLGLDVSRKPQVDEKQGPLAVFQNR